MSRSRAAALLALVCALYAAWGAVYIQRTSIEVGDTRVYTLWDDAMISMRYAENFRNGDGLVWNAGEEAVQGYTNLGVTLGMAALHWLPIGPFKLSLVVQAACLLGLLWMLVLVWQIGTRLAPEQPAVAIGALLGTALSAPLGIWGLQGSDTTAVALWLLIGARAFANSEQSGEPWPRWLVAWIALGPVIRLDCAIYVAVFALGIALISDRRARDLTALALSAAAVVGSLLLFSYLYYGDPLPNTWYLKATGTPRLAMLQTGAAVLVRYWPGLSLALAVGAYAVWKDRHLGFARVAGALVLVALLYTIWTGGDWAPENGLRFFVPVLPLLMLLASRGCSLALGAAPGARATARPVLATLIVATFTNPIPALAEWFDLSRPTMYYEDNHRNAHVGLYFREYSDPRTRLALHWGGLPAYISERPVVDVLGKSDRTIARMQVEHFHPGHSKWDWRYTLYVQRPDVFLIASRRLDERRDFRAQFVRATSERTGVQFYLRRTSTGLLVDPTLRLQDLRSGESWSIGEDAPRGS